MADLRSGKCLQVSVHFLVATALEGDVAIASRFISSVLGYPPQVREHGHFGYTRMFVWFGGLKLMVNEKRPQMGHCLVAEGDACEFYGFTLLAYIYQSLQFRATRLDLAVDGCRFAPSALHTLWLRDWVRCNVRRPKDAKPGRERHRTYEWIQSPTGDTLYLGSRTSTQYVRVYNQRGFTRLELVLRRERATQAMEALCGGAELAATAGALIGRFVTFVEPRGTNRSRATPLPFWTRFLERLTTNDVVTRLEPRPEATVARFIERIETVYAPDIVVYEILKGKWDNFDDVRRRLRRLGLEQITPRHEGLIKAGGDWLWAHDAPRFKVVKDEPLSMLELNEQIKKAA